MANEWRRWRTSFSSVPAFTDWERDTVDCMKTESKNRHSIIKAMETFLSFSSDMIYHGAVEGTIMMFDSHCVDHSVLLFLHHSRLQGKRGHVMV